MKVIFRVILCLAPLISCAQKKHQPTESNFIVVDQFGYLPDAKKTAIIRTPEVGYDSDTSFAPAETYAVYNIATSKVVYSNTISSWQNGLVDTASGDKVWYFDFTKVHETGSYYILDKKNNARSYEFEIKPNVYKKVLKVAFKTFYYQRAGFEKTEEFAGEGYADKASHVGPLQDKNCREWKKDDDASTEKDVHGGWYDAGDFNKYTNWTSDYVQYLLLAYEENPSVWTDDFDIPESGNGIPDVLDEVRFGLEHLLRLQFDDGSLIAIVGSCDASPPSSGTAPSHWGGPSTSATLSGAAAYAYGARMFANIDTAFAAQLTQAAFKAYNWAEKNPNVTFFNNSGEHGTAGLAAGQNEVDDYGRMQKKMNAAMHLYALTGDKKYKEYFEAHVLEVHMFTWYFLFPFGSPGQDMLLYYTKLDNVSPAIVDTIKAQYIKTINRENNFGALDAEREAYLAYTKDFDWGSNGIIAKQGLIYYNLLQYNIYKERQPEAKDIAARYIHYLHGVNPLNKCYLTNMSAYGSENSANVVYHAWFKDGSELWDDCRTSKYGPAPGFIVGGANPSYDWDGCCPKDCDSEYNNSLCFQFSITPPKGQPKLKSYADINTGWPINSWSITENSCWYQTMYLRLLSKYIE